MSNCFGPTKKRTILRRLRKPERVRQQLALRLVRPGERQRAELDRACPGSTAAAMK